MRKYACDVCGLTFNDYGHFENGKPCNLYELKMLNDDSGLTYHGFIVCHRCFEKILIKGRCERNSNGSDSPGSCVECKHMNKAPYEEPCKNCSHSFMNLYEKEDPEDVPSEQ